MHASGTVSVLSSAACYQINKRVFNRTKLEERGVVINQDHNARGESSPITHRLHLQSRSLLQLLNRSA